ncbi:hypothetical protein LSAT2_010820, partial [Lamellibrachia satsuma]
LSSASERCQAKYFEVFHRGVYNVKQQAYTCCGSVDRYSKGCAPTTFCPSKEKDFHRPHHIFRLSSTDTQC